MINEQNSNEIQKPEESVNSFFDDILKNLNLLKSFSIKLDERLSDLEEKVEDMVDPLNDLKRIMLD